MLNKNYYFIFVIVSNQLSNTIKAPICHFLTEYIYLKFFFLNTNILICLEYINIIFDTF